MHISFINTTMNNMPQHAVLLYLYTFGNTTPNLHLSISSLFDTNMHALHF